ncbi:MAG: tyrosine-type recombinase/integrase [Chloroflexota bacterium]
MRRPHSLAEQYDQTLHYTRDKRLPAGHPRPQPTSCWPKENIELYERYRAWLLGGGTSELASKIIYLPVAGHVLGLALKPHPQIDLEADFQRALEYVIAKRSGPDWIKASRNGLNKFRRFMRLARGLGEESHVTPFDSGRVTAGLPAWLVSELDRFQRLMQPNWREARLEQNIRRFWSGYLRMWRFFVEQKGVQLLDDLKRPFVLDYVDLRLSQGHSASGVNGDLRNLRSFLLFLQEEGYSVPQSLLRIPNLKPPEPLPKYLTDEQVKKLRDEIERGVREAKLSSHRRLALLARAAFYLLWQGGMRRGEVEELRLEDLDLEQKRLSVRDGKGRKDRTVYLTETAICAVQEYLAVRGDGSGDHVFLYRQAPLKKDIVRDQIKHAGERAGVKVYPHRLRHTCATQLLNAGCRVTSIQRFLGHKKLSSTMVYAKAHDQTVAEDYFAAMSRVEERLDFSPPKQEESACAERSAVLSLPKGRSNEIVNVPETTQILGWIDLLALPELDQDERLEIAENLKQALCLDFASQLSPPAMAYAG